MEVYWYWLFKKYYGLCGTRGSYFSDCFSCYFVESAGKIAVSNGAGVLQSLAIMFGSLIQAILLIIALVGSQRTARSILGM